VTRDMADYALLKLANEKGKFAIQVNLPIPDLQHAFERGIDAEWFTLVDVSFIAEIKAPVLMRVFRLTAAGWERLRALKGRFDI
jgi:hypothetical protein